MIRRVALAATSAIAFVLAASPTLAQSMQNMPGMTMPMPAKKPPAKAKPSTVRTTYFSLPGIGLELKTTTSVLLILMYL